jgi:ribonuclease VapC
VIAVDTSAVVAIVLREATAEACKAALAAEDDILISAGTLAELLVVAVGRGIAAEVTEFLDQFEFNIIPLTAAGAQRIGDAYQRWGRGLHAAALNFGDCFAYALAKEQGCRLLYVGDDFAKTDIDSVL